MADKTGADENKTPQIVEYYRKYPDLLKVYFKSEEDAADCERRAEMGDDRAMRTLSLAYDSRVASEAHFEWKRRYGSTAAPGVGHYVPETAKAQINVPIAPHLRNQWNMKAILSGNLDALYFVSSTAKGNRSISYNQPIYEPEVKELHGNHKLQLFDSTHNYENPIVIKNNNSSDNNEPFTKFSRFVLRKPNKALENQISKADIRFEVKPLSKDACNANIIFEPVLESSWPTDYEYIFNTAHRIHDNQKYSRHNLIYLDKLTECAKSGDINAAIRLSEIYNQKTFNSIIVKTRFFGKPDYADNVVYSPAKAAEWKRIAEHLEGKSPTPIEREKFLKEFLYSQDSTPEGLYNIGYALFHNDKIGNKQKGVDYLKHAANLGNANAARELGEIYHDGFDLQGDRKALEIAHFWYKVAADLGHPNGKARQAYLEKAYPDLLKVKLNEAETRNPSPDHIKKYPASMWLVDVPITDVGAILKNKKGSIEERVQQATDAIDEHVGEFKKLLEGTTAKIIELQRRQDILDGRVDARKGEELDAITHNSKLDEKIDSHARAAQHSRDRLIQENAMNLAASIVLIPLTGGGSVASAAGRSLTRAVGNKGASENEVDFREEMMEQLEAKKIDTSKFSSEIEVLAKSVQAVADSIPAKKLFQDETRSRALMEGLLRQRILKSGLEVTRTLNEYAETHRADSVDAMLEQFAKTDQRLASALENLCYGHANSNDLAVILTDANALQGTELQPHEKALKRYVESIVKKNIGEFAQRASQIDVIEDLQLVDFNTMQVDHQRTSADLIRGMRDLTQEQAARAQVDSATKLALSAMFARDFGGSRSIGQQSVTDMFKFYLHRHGRDQLISADLFDGQVRDQETEKKVKVEDEKSMSRHTERVKEAAARRLNSQPVMDNLFLRTCVYDYYLPQAVDASGGENRFRQNPEAPVAYPAVNAVVQNFIERMSLTDIAEYRHEIGEDLDKLIVQTFFDFFKAKGKEHETLFAQERERLREAYQHEHYGTRFDAYSDKITANILEDFPKFLEIYEKNLDKTLLVAREGEAKALREQIRSLREDTRQYLDNPLLEETPAQTKERARRTDHRGSNMSEGWRRFG